MASRTFKVKVARMRALQMEYAKTRSIKTLEAAKKAEKEVDEVLAALFPAYTPSQDDDNHPKLFPL